MTDFNPVDHMYKGGFFKNRHRLSWRAPIVVDALCDTFDLKEGSRVVDVGCAIGDYVKEFQERRIDGHGLEGSKAAEEFFVTDQIAVKDLRKPVGFYGLKYDLAYSLEVAEHIESAYSDIYIDNLCTLSDTILISAASPGQKGHGHVNCAPRQYWVDKFLAKGYFNYTGLEALWRLNLWEWKHKKELSSYIRNAIIFKKEK